MDLKDVKKTILNPNKTKNMRELGPVDISTIRDDIIALPEDVWDLQNSDKPNNFREFHSTKHIIFKFVKSFNDCRTSYDFPIWKDWEDRIQPILEEAVKPYGYPDGIFSRVMLAKLNPKSDISIHKDGNKAATFPHKIHIPILTNKDCMFFVNPKIYHFEEGKAYEVNNQASHYVDNQGEIMRIHLIFEYFSEGILQATLRDSVA